MDTGSPRAMRSRSKPGHDRRDSNDDSLQHNQSGYRDDESGSDLDGNDYSPYTKSHSSFSSSPISASDSRSPSGLYPDLSSELQDMNMSSYSDRSKGRESADNSLHRRVDYKSIKASPKGGRSLEKDKKKAEPSPDSNNINLVYVVVFMVFIAVVVYMLMHAGSSSANVKDSSNAEAESGFDHFQKNVQMLQSSFPSQTKRFWNTVSASARHVYYQQDPCYPSVILMASHNKNQRLNECLAKKIAFTFSLSRGVSSGDSNVGINIEAIKHFDPEQQKLELDDHLKLAFQKRGEKAFVISNVQHLAPKAALLLHGFCDGDNAPYQDVMILLLFQVDDGVVFKSVKDVEDQLVKIWSKGLDMDKLSAIMSRIANNQVVVLPESESVENSMCS